jgi:hypothetical protein
MDIQDRLKEQYGLVVDGTSLKEVLDDLTRMGPAEIRGVKYRRSEGRLWETVNTNLKFMRNELKIRMKESSLV